MNAIQPSFFPPEPIQKKPLTPRRKRHLRQRYYRAMAVEMTLKIGVNMAVATVAVSALTSLLPYHWSQQEKLREISTQVKRLEGNVNKLRADFSRNFDPHQTKTIMQEQGYRFDPNQRRVIWNKDSVTYPQ
ncbi:MAG: hypothetical protein QNJ63_21170 [Calothrix sp. MO_192.B10]|nr:hypothetical protein [Calothrix sp. MO_192.B10]